MKLYSLRKYGIPDMILDAWKNRQGEQILPLQERAIHNGLLGSHDDHMPLPNLLISAPTSSGKSFCGEMAAIDTLLHRKKTIMLFPLKSIIEEKYDYFRECYRSLGIKTIIVTGDHPENDEDFHAGDFDLALGVYEKFDNLLTANPDILCRIGLIVVDELQMIGDPKRGPKLEMALTKVLVSGYRPRLVALSAVLNNEDSLAAWLECNLIRETVRPVDLQVGVACNGHFRYRSFNNASEGTETIGLEAGGDDNESLLEFLKSDNSRRLVFVKSRKDTIKNAFKLAPVVNWPSAQKTLNQLKGEEKSYLIRSLRQVLSRGVAFHNADLTIGQRRLIEDGYRRGEIKLIFSTTTLAMGVNLPAETVFLETMKYSSGSLGGEPQLVPIGVSDFLNISGRAGRFGHSPNNRPGRAVVLAHSDFEREVLWSTYIDGDRNDRILSKLSELDIKDVVLNFLTAFRVRNLPDLKSILDRAFGSSHSGQYTDDDLQYILDELKTDGFIKPSLEPIPLGRATAESGLPTTAVVHYRDMLARHTPANLTGWLSLLLSGESFDLSGIGLSMNDYNLRLYERALFERFSDYLTEVSAYVDAEIGRQKLDFNSVARLKATFVLSDWTAGKPVEKLEQSYRLHHGQIVKLAENAGWLLRGIAQVIEALERTSPLPELLRDHAFQVQHGIDPCFREIFTLSENLLNREDYARLKEQGYLTLSDFEGCTHDDLKGVVIPGDKGEKFLERLRLKVKEATMASQTNTHEPMARKVGAGITPAEVERPSIVELDGSYERERYLVRIDGFPVRLTGKSFKYLTKLAGSRLMDGDGWIYKDDIELGFNQARYLYRLKQEISKEGGFPWQIFENNRLGYYRLDLEPSQIKLNLSNLKSHPDYELRAMAEQLAMRMAS